MSKFLRLGRADGNVTLSAEEKRRYFSLYHNPAGFPQEAFTRFRDDTRNQWWDLENIEGDRIKELTRFLHAAGFMPNATHDGIFGYGTQSAVRLFQEYVRTVDKDYEDNQDAPPRWPDGVVGNDTSFYISDWNKKKKRTHWADTATETEDYTKWLTWLGRVAEHYRANPTPLMQQLIDARKRGDSLIPEEWAFPRDEPLLVGIRRNAHLAPPAGEKRPPDDYFVLLINGKSFYFRGSTDSNPAVKKKGLRKGEGFLLEGQHHYGFNWHNLSESKRPHIYKAMRPAGRGVMVVRDINDHNALTDENRRDGFDKHPNGTYNIHWNGLGISNWSAGCQVISGSNYVNDRGELIDCRDFAARNARERGSKRKPDGPRLTMGAYTVFSDLLFCYTRPTSKTEKPAIRYTLFREEDMEIGGGEGKSLLHVFER